MTAPRDHDRLINAFLEDGSDLLPDRAFDEVRRDIHRTRQRVVVGPWREPRMSNVARYTILAATIVILVGAGAFLLRPSPAGIAAPSASPTPTPSEPPASAMSAGPYAVGPGRVRLTDDQWTLGVTVPAGWSHSDLGLITKDYGPTDVDAGPALVLWNITGTFVDPCTDHTRKPEPSGVDGLVADLADQPGTTAGPITDVIVDGYAGKSVELTVTTDITTCGTGTDGFWLWASPGDRRYVQGTNEMNRMYVLDVDGERLTFDARIPAITTAADRAELEAVIASIDISRYDTLRSPSPSASP
jgi:hypothetical protein